MTQYLVKWRHYGPEFNEWLSESNMEGARGMIDAFEAARASRRRDALIRHLDDTSR